MKTVSLALFAGIFGCAFVHGVPAAEAGKFKETILHSFTGVPDGETPYAGLIDVKGMLYGTTYVGGDNGFGTVFALDRHTGAEKVLYSLEDQAFPQASLIDVKGTLYGTASGGGENEGWVFAFDLSTGAGTTVYTFCSKVNCADGAVPIAALINVKGTLYGTTAGGGSTSCSGGGCGVVFSLDPSTSAENVLYTFCSHANCTDGAHPSAGLVEEHGSLYSTTRIGGSHNQGTVYAVNATTGAETVVYSFCSQAGCADGAEPLATLIDVNGILYGTTYRGGNSGGGTVFSVDPTTGAETVIYAFCSEQNCADGAYPLASLIDVNSTLYGTTLDGGGAGCGSGGCGAVFSIDPNTGTEKVLYAFRDNGMDGTGPGSGLIDVNGELYSTTDFGDPYGYGTVFVLKRGR